MTNTTTPRGQITYDPDAGHVCTCSALTDYDGAGYPCQTIYSPTVHVDRDTAPTDSGSWLYVCSACGASGWSGC